MPKINAIYENSVLVSLDKLSDMPSEKWDWRYAFLGKKGTLYIMESVKKNKGKHFIVLTDKKDFRLTTGYGEIQMAEKFIRITTKNSSYIFLTE